MGHQHRQTYDTEICFCCIYRLYCFGGFGVPLKKYLQDGGKFLPDSQTPWVRIHYAHIL